MTRITLNVLMPVCCEGTAAFVAGNCPELGSWSPQLAKPMTLIKDDGDKWSTTVEVSVERLEYRYFTACILQSFSDPSAGNCDYIVAVQNWESGKKPRIIELTGASINCDIDVYGDYDGVRSVSRGWLTGQCEVCLQIHGEAMWLKADAGSQARYHIKCEPVDMRPADSSGTSCSIHRRFSPVSVAKFSINGFAREAASCVSFNGTNDHITFKIQTTALEMMACKFFLYCDREGDNCSKLNEIGVAFYHISATNESDTANISVISSGQQIMGSLRVNAVVVNPMKNLPKDHSFSPQRWEKPQQSLSIGHRGLGKTYVKGVSVARAPENTVHSFSEAARSGADMVEFDVMLTSDKVPVVFHDFMASANIMSADGSRSHSLKVPVSDLTVEELKTLSITKLQDSAVDVSKNEDDHPFPTLRHCFEVVDPHLKFNIEVKYCMHLLKTGQYEEGVQHFPERNSYLDVILDDIFQHSGDREILLSCFDPDVCIMLCAKQARYPVAFLSQGETGKYETFQDTRASTLQIAVNFANVESLMGVVLHTECLLKDMQLIDHAHSCGLSVFCWGEENNSVDTIKLLRKLKLDGIICDRVDEFMQAVNVDQGYCVHT